MRKAQKWGARHRIALATVAGLCGVAALAGVANAKWTVVQVGNLVFKVEGRVSPAALPRDGFAPTTFHARGEIATADNTHPPALREGVVYVDKNTEVDGYGLPVCKAGQLEARDTKGAKRVCGEAIIGSGSGIAEISFPEQQPIPVKSPLIVFNGGTRGGTTTMYIHAFITVPVPAALVTTFKFRNVRAGRYGVRGIFKLPVIAGGSGSVTGFNLEFGRSYVYRGLRKSYGLASCPDGHLDFKGEANFKDEAGDGEKTSIAATLALPCTPKG